MSLSILGRLGRRGRLARRDEARTVEEWSRRLEIKAGAPSSLISTLSGGNQQKVVVARCLASDPKMLVLCEPTAGVDIGTRVAIYELDRRLAPRGPDGDRLVVGRGRSARACARASSCCATEWSPRR